MAKTVKYTFTDVLDSSALDALFYDANNGELYVEFQNGSIAGYAGVGPGVVDDLVNADSVGSFYALNIKNKYRGIDGKVILEPYNALADSNTNPYAVRNAPIPATNNTPEPESDDEGVYEISFLVDGTTQFKAPKGNLVQALELFVGSFNENNDATVRVRSIKEVE